MKRKAEEIFRKTKEELLFDFLPTKLKEAGYKKLVHGKYFLYAEGNISVLLTAHADTVFESPLNKIFFDSEKGIFWSPEGLGADDRAGIYGILYLIQKGYRPYILFTDLEERGIQGAKEAANTLELPPVKIVIELDRRGSEEAVFYDCICPEFEQYILDYGFKKADGSFTDISVICPKWKLPGVNLSTGYYNEHTELEYFVLSDLFNTLEKVEEMLQNPPQQSFNVYFKNSAFGLIDEIFSDINEAIDEYNVPWDEEEDMPKCCMCEETADELYSLPNHPDCHVCIHCFEIITGREPLKEELVFFL
jgi:hypothetical protein